MKTLIRMVFISLIGLHPVFGQIPWTLITPNPPRLGAYTAVSIGTRAYFWTTNNTVYSTFDGGNTFSVAQYETIGDVALGDGYNQGMAFTDSLTGFISDIAYGQFKTTDGGKSWRMVIDRANLEGSVLLFANKQIVEIPGNIIRCKSGKPTVRAARRVLLMKNVFGWPGAIS